MPLLILKSSVVNICKGTKTEHLNRTVLSLDVKSFIKTLFLKAHKIPIILYIEHILVIK